MSADVEHAIEHLARHDAGRVLAIVARRFGDLDLADDAVQDALLVATTRWPDDGIPDNPAAWLHQVARRKAIDALRRSRSAAQRTTAAAPELARTDEAPFAADRRAADGGLIMTDAGLDPGDERLRLILLCCHPALDADAQVALTLRLVGGLTTDEIAAAFLVPTPTVAQRISRAKRKIRDAGIPMRLPTDDVRAGASGDERGSHAVDGLHDRLGFVRKVLYLVFNEGYLSRSATDGGRRLDLCEEAIRLTAILVNLTDGDAESLGLLALMRFTHARRDARFRDGAIVLLDEQDRRTWRLGEIQLGNTELRSALEVRRPGPLQLQAVIASLHANARTPDDTDWVRIVALYDQLFAMRPDPVVALNRAAAIGMADGPDAGLRELDRALELPDAERLERLHLTHATRGELLRRAGRRDEAADALRRARALTDNPAERTHLDRRLVSLDVS